MKIEQQKEGQRYDMHYFSQSFQIMKDILNYRMEHTTSSVLGKKQIASLVLAFWLLIIVIFMLLAHQFNFEIFFVLGFIGILVIAELSAPRYVKPGILRYLKYLVAAASAIFSAIVIHFVLIILGMVAI